MRLTRIVTAVGAARDTAARIRDWGVADYYAVLGVPVHADAEEIANAYRRLAKAWHPDRRPGDGEAHERFAALTVAFDVLGDPDTRARYDVVRGLRTTRHDPPRDSWPVDLPPHEPPVRRPMSPTRARWLLGAALALVLAGVCVGAAVVALQRSEARDRSQREPARAVVADVDGGQVVVFTTVEGERIVAPAPQRQGEPLGETAAVRYDPANPTDIVLAESTLGRDLTLWVVALKLLVGGIIFAIVAARRLRSGTVNVRPIQSVAIPYRPAQFS